MQEGAIDKEKQFIIIIFLVILLFKQMSGIRKVSKAGGKIKLNSFVRILLIISGLLICSLFALLGLDIANNFFEFWPTHINLIPAWDIYEIFRDLLFLLVAGLGIVGYFIYKQIRSTLEEDLKKSIEQIENKVYVRLFNSLSDIHFSEYQEYQRIEGLEDKDKSRWRNLCKLAADEAEQAISYCEKLDEKIQQGLINVLRVNLAYHLAVLGDIDNKAKALKLVNVDNREKAIKYAGKEEYQIRESAIWVILRFSDNKNEKDGAIDELQGLKKWKGIPQEWKDKISRKYKNIGIYV